MTIREAEAQWQGSSLKEGSGRLRLGSRVFVGGRYAI
jgi:hypothetical protein